MLPCQSYQPGQDLRDTQECVSSMADMVDNFGLQTGSLQECSLPRSPMLVKCKILYKNGLLGATIVLPCIY